ncbi:MAG TPA: hypothetical protein VEF04_11205, partial [Blastocatellia bacterium]|nr:hypothetical protein [Blastocatellia bacterium]
MLIRFSFVACLLLLLLGSAFTQEKGHWGIVIPQLLDYPAPPPPKLKVVADAMAAQEERAKRQLENPEAVPGADAVASEIIEYWDRQVRQETGKEPSEQQRWRLMEAYLQEPNLYSRVVQLFPDTPQAHERIKEFLAQPEPLNATDWEIIKFKDAQGNLRRWLMQRSEYYREELLRYASEVKIDGPTLVGENSLTALARLDWKSAQPLLENYRRHSESAISTLAMRLLYLHAVKVKDRNQAEDLRQQLQRLVTNPQVSEKAREMAYETVMQHEWEGREDWFTSLFAMEQLLEGKKPLLREHILVEPVKKDPEKWIPILRSLVTNSITVIHNNAALCLKDVVFRKPNRDALLALLPWLTNPEWVTAGDEHDRYRVINAMGVIQLPEAIPGLLAILQN